MNKFTKALAAIMLTVVVVIAAGCTKPEDPVNPNNGGGNGGDNGGGNGGNPTLNTEGIYLGIIGFNQHQYEKEIGLLNASTQSTFSEFIDGLQMENLTGLYYADYLALQRMQSYGEPPKLAKVALVTFTDGLDNTSVSPATPELNPEHYPNKEAYLNALNIKIKNDKVYENSINAYTIGLKGTDALSNLEEFRYNMQMLASSESNVYEADNVNQVIENFAVIADNLYSETATASLKLLLPGGYPDGLEMRFTFDGNPVAENSSLYIDCKYRNLGTAIQLESITYHGFKDGESVMESNEVENGFMKFVFVDLTKNNGNLISESDKEKLQVYKKTTTSWGLDSEFDKDQQSHIITEQKSAVIMLVLDCTTSLGTDSFAKMKEAAKRFIGILLSSNNGGGGGGNGGGALIPTVTTSSVTEITSNSATCGGNVTSDGGSLVTQVGICWSTSHNPTTNDSYAIETEWMGGSFSKHIEGLSANTTYYVRAFATNAVGTAYGQERSFTTTNDVSLPSVTTLSVTNITQNSATGGGNVTSDGGATVTERGICWSISQNPSISNAPFQTCGSGTGSFTATISPLSANTTYYVRAYAKNSAGIAYGVQKSFKTSSSSNQAWLHYDEGDITGNWGWSNEEEMEWAVMFPTSNLTSYSGTSITKVQAYLGEWGWFTVKIYRGGTTQPSTLLYEEEFYVDEAGWNTFDIDPLTLNTSQPLWVSIIAEDGGHPAGACKGVSKANARWVYSSGLDEWIDMMDVNNSVDLAWALRVYVTNSAKGEKGIEMELPQKPHVKHDVGGLPKASFKPVK